MNKKLKKVAIFGKPNVGKSCLFNRMSKHKSAIVLPEAGTTRDRIITTVEWLTRKFDLIDTGGLSSQKLNFQENINEQARIAATEADLVLLMVSCHDGLTNDDWFVANALKKLPFKKVFLVANKAENIQNKNDVWEDFSKLGFGVPYFISAEHGINIGDLLDDIVKYLEIEAYTTNEDSTLKFTIIGKPNVGKSSLANAILHQDRLIVSEIAGTTRDAIDCEFQYNNKSYCLIDTAGIRRAGQANKEDVERYSVLRAKKSIQRAKIILLVLDIATGLTEQDEVVGGLAHKTNIPTIIIANKWDAIKNKTSTKMVEMTKLIQQKFNYLAWAPIIFLSAKNETRIHLIFETIEEIQKQLTKKVAVSLLNDVITKAQALHPIPNVKGQKIRFSYAVQVNGQIPTFVIFCNNPELLHFSYGRYVENQIRTAFGFDKVPITVFYKAKNSSVR